MSPFYGNLGIRGEKTGHEREISGDRPFELRISYSVTIVFRDGFLRESRGTVHSCTIKRKHFLAKIDMC